MTPKNPSPIILPDEEDKLEEPGVLDNVENRVIMTTDKDGQVIFAIGKALNPFQLINMAWILNRIASKMVDQIEARQMQEAMQTASVMESLRAGRGPLVGDPFGRVERP